MGEKILFGTTNKIVTITGKVLYNDSRRRIDLKLPVRQLFSSSSSKVEYVMELCLSKEQVLSRLEKLSEQKTMPVLLYFTDEGGEDSNAVL